ncbi:MAG: hypothetical protein ABSG30_08545 [Steroidobacteraceae bacterium]|jgi:hypothetical protein
MSIRDYIKRRFRNLSLLFALPYAILQMLRIVVLYYPDAFPRKVSVLVLMFTDYRVLCVVLAWFALRIITIPCPRCSRPLGAAIAVIWGSQKIHRCPNCRVSIDAPVKESEVI